MPWPVGKIITQHHERLDGSGYPNGLKADQICLEARIISPCDALEAITSHRPYRPSKPLSEALAFLQEGRDKWFDAQVVDVLTELIGSGELRFLEAET